MIDYLEEAPKNKRKYLQYLQAGIKTKASGIFQSVDKLLLFNKKIANEFARENATLFGSYKDAWNFYSFSQRELVEFIDGVPSFRTVTVRNYFFQELEVLTILDYKQFGSSSSSVIEVRATDRGKWEVDIGYPSHHSWWEFDSLEEALEFGKKNALAINFAESPEEELRKILSL